jgi:TPR repeat protein
MKMGAVVRFSYSLIHAFTVQESYQPWRWGMSGIKGRSFRVMLLAATILALQVTVTISADINILRKQAEAGDAKAQNSLGMMYSDGRGVARDDAEAAKWYRKAAEQGNAGAQFSLGYLYSTGEGVPLDSVESAKWFRKAAEQGDADSQLHLGRAYYEGNGVKQDYPEAAKWFRKGAEQGDANGMFLMGAMYVVGKGVPQDLVQSYSWYSMAASKGTGDTQKEATAAMTMLAKKLAPEKIAEAKRMAREWEKSHPGK